MSVIPANSFEESFSAWEQEFSRYRALLKERNRKYPNLKRIYCRVEKFWDWLRENRILPQELTILHYNRFTYELRSGELCTDTDKYSTHSLKIFTNHAKAWTRSLYERGVFLTDPFDEARAVKVPQIVFSEALTKEQVKELLLLPDLTAPLGLRNRAILEVLYGSGLRGGELIGLSLQSLDLADRVLYLRNTKNGWDRCVPFTRPAAQILSRYLQEARPQLQGPKAGDALWLSYHRRPLTNAVFDKISKTYSRQLGFRVTMHALRHACATHLLEGGASIRHIAELLGHQQLDTTAYYAKARLEELRRVHRRTHPRG